MPRSIAAALTWLLLLAGTSSAADPPAAERTEEPEKVAKLDPAEQNALLDEVLAAWARRRALFKSVAYVIEGEDRYPRGSLTFGDPLVFMPPPPGGFPITPAEDYDAPVRCEVVLDFAGRADSVVSIPSRPSSSPSGSSAPPSASASATATSSSSSPRATEIPPPAPPTPSSTTTNEAVH
jgi:hypothetical protein